jgi:hypothetical protein
MYFEMNLINSMVILGPDACGATEQAISSGDAVLIDARRLPYCPWVASFLF